MSAKMIVTDLDGTLLRTDKTISERTKSILRQCRKAGIKVVHATGRGKSAEKLAPSELFDGRITINGAIAKIGEMVIYRQLIPYTTAGAILMACNERGMKITSEHGGVQYSNFDVSEEWADITNFEIVDFSKHEIDAEKIYTLNPSLEDKAFIEQLLPDDLYFVVTNDVNGFLGQIMHKNATKAKAVAVLAQYWNIPESEIVSFGDDYNDLDMLKFSGIGVAMENAVDEVKAIADYICLSNDEDGMSEWIRSHVDIAACKQAVI